ncbi:MAG: TetR/AcrR family transcriptional regulator [bacterium]|nr:TetR/AcrR family transcriptional regulator [bacterium]
MGSLSPKQREIREREQLVLKVAREMFFEQGYYGLTMGKIAREIGCAKGTVYLHFPCKEDLILALALQCHERRQALFARALGSPGRSREHLVAVAYAAEIYTRLYPGDMQIFHSITGPLREKTSPERDEAFRLMEHQAMLFLVGVFDLAVVDGDLVLPSGVTPGHLAWEFWSLADGAHGLVLSDVSLADLGVTQPYASLMRSVHRLADSYGWKPLTCEWDYDVTLDRVRREVFPEESRRLMELEQAESGDSPIG